VGEEDGVGVVEVDGEFVLDPETGTRIAAVTPWPGRVVDTTGCLETVTVTSGPSVASTVIVLPMDWIPFTEQ
jgi:hypothetical protein